MGGKVSIVNKTMCFLSVSLNVRYPYYWDNILAPGATMHRSAGHVWFTIEAFPWHGGDNAYYTTDSSPSTFTNSHGEVFTLIDNIGIRGNHTHIIGKTPNDIDLRYATPLEKKLTNIVAEAHFLPIPYGKLVFYAPFLMDSMGWYVYNNNVWEIHGGPHCELLHEFYMKDGTIHQRNMQIFDDRMGLNGLYVKRVV